MTKSNRDVAITECLKWEGGYSNDAADPGGPTNYGITIADVRMYVKSNATAADVKALTKAQAIQIYQGKYWKTKYYDCDNLASGVDLAVFDFGVNSGPARAKKYLDASVGGTSEETINKLCDKRLAFLQGLKTWPNFGKGWSRRVAGIRVKSLQLAKNPSTASVGAGAVVVGGASAAISAPHHYLPWIIAGTIIVAAFVGLAIYAYEKSIKEEQKVTN